MTKAKVVLEKTKNGITTREKVKEGVVVAFTTRGANIFDPKDPGDKMDFAEWFPFQSRAGLKVILSS